MENNYSLSDLRAVTGDGFGMGNGGGFLILLILFLLLGGNGNYGRNMDGFGQFATSASQNEILLGQKFDAISRQIGAIGDGICNSTYALNNTIVGEGRSMQAQLSDVAAATNATTVAQTQKILDALSQNKIDELRAQVTRLETQNMFCGIPRINPYGYGVYPYGTGCGCNCAGANI